MQKKDLTKPIPPQKRVKRREKVSIEKDEVEMSSPVCYANALKPEQLSEGYRALDEKYRDKS